MSEMLTPLEWNSVPPGSGAALSRLWPTPPFACYPAATAITEPLACEIRGINDSRMHGRLNAFLPNEGIARVQMASARAVLPLRFDQFRSITLTTPLHPLAASGDDPHRALLSPGEPVSYSVTLLGGVTARGQTIGHVEKDEGLYLFAPADANGAVLRLFFPRAGLQDFEVGQPLGEVLVDSAFATFDEVEQAVGLQQDLRSKRVGDILVMRHLVSSEQLLTAIEQQAKMPMVRIGEALMSLGMITQAHLDQALAQQKLDRSLPLGELLVRMGVVSSDDLQIALARKMGYPLVDVDAFPAEADALRRVSYAVAARLSVMPLLVRDGRLVVALDDPARRRNAVDEIEFVASMKVVPVLAKCRSLADVIHNAYDKIGATSKTRVSADPSQSMHFDTADTDKLVESLEKEGREVDDDAPIEQSDNSLVRLINNMIIEAHKDGVSDIHIESYPGREKIRVRFRKDGVLTTYLELPPNYRSALIGRIKVMCELDISERRKPQDGKINFSKFSPQHRLELRVATIPTNNGLEDVVMRILASARPLPMDQLDLSPENLKKLTAAIERPYGMVLCVGPTGSGKTTTLHSALNHINTPERKIWTAEDPIEITQAGLRQVQVNPKIDWTFAKALRAFLRADPDVIMVGEIRDGETAQITVEASLTGHLVLSTLHTNSAAETVTRLLDMGMDPFNFGDSLLAVLAQRLVRRLCGDCRVDRAATGDEIDELLGDYMHSFGAASVPVTKDDVLAGWKRNSRGGRLVAYRGTGCVRCDQTGYKSRAGLHEMMVISRELRRLIQTGARAEELQDTAMAQGMRTLRQDGIDKVMAGLTSIEEVRATSNF